MKVLLSFTTLLLFTAFTACKKKNNCMQHHVTSAELQGNWAVAQAGDIVSAGIARSYKFDGTTVYIKERHFSDIADTNTVACPFYNFTEYERAAYGISDDTLKLGGNYTDSTYHPIDTGCFNFGVYQNQYKAWMTCDSLYLQPLSPFYPGNILVLYRQ